MPKITILFLFYKPISWLPHSNIYALSSKIQNSGALSGLLKYA